MIPRTCVRVILLWIAKTLNRWLTVFIVQESIFDKSAESKNGFKF